MKTFLAAAAATLMLGAAPALAQGYPNKIVAEKLSITEGTAKLHLHHVYEKLGVNGRMALVRYLRDKGWD